MSIPKGQGRWVPLHTGFTCDLPNDRRFTRLEAAYSVQVDYDRQNTATIAGYAKQWMWSRGKVERFLQQVGATIYYPENTTRKQNQRGQIMIQTSSRNRTDTGQIKLINSREIDDGAGRHQADDDQVPSRSKGATIQKGDSRLKKEKKINTSSSSGDDGSALFDLFWKEYPRKTHKIDAYKAFQRFKPDKALVSEMVRTLEWQRKLPEWADTQFIPHPKSWLEARRWEDEPYEPNVSPCGEGEDYF